MSYPQHQKQISCMRQWYRGIACSAGTIMFPLFHRNLYTVLFCAVILTAGLDTLGFSFLLKPLIHGSLWHETLRKNSTSQSILFLTCHGITNILLKSSDKSRFSDLHFWHICDILFFLEKIHPELTLKPWSPGSPTFPAGPVSPWNMTRKLNLEVDIFNNDGVYRYCNHHDNTA